MAVSTHIVIFWFVMQCIIESKWKGFEENFCLHHQDQNDWDDMQPKYIDIGK
jgi:hypothetical protein